MLVAVARQKLWDRERATPQPTSGSVTHEKKTNTSNGLTASTTVSDEKQWALSILEKKSVRG